MLTFEMAKRLRNRGLQLPVNGGFENAHLLAIAMRMRDLFNELEQLDREIIRRTSNEGQVTLAKTGDGATEMD